MGATEVTVGVTARIRGHRALHLEVDAPSQRMALPVPEAELPVMATGEETVLERMCAEPPELIRVTLQRRSGCHLCPSPTALPSLLPETLDPPTWITGEKPWARSPRSNAFFVVPTSSSEPGPSAMARTAPKCSGICRGAQNVRCPRPFLIPLLPLTPGQPSPPPPEGPPTRAPTGPAGGPAHHHSAQSRLAGDTGRRWNLHERGPGPQSHRSLLAKSGWSCL